MSKAATAELIELFDELTIALVAADARSTLLLAAIDAEIERCDTDWRDSGADEQALITVRLAARADG